MTKPDMSADCMELALELASQPALFSEKGEPTGQLAERFTGARVELDDERCMAACALRLLGASDRELATALHCDVRSIPFLLASAERSGRIPALKERLTTQIGAAAESSAITLTRLLDDAASGGTSIELAAMIKAVGTSAGITTERYLLLTGCATEIVEHRVAAGREEMEAWARANAVQIEVEATPIDSKSSAIAPNLIITGGFTPDGHGNDTSSVRAVVVAAGDQEGGGGDLAAGGEQKTTMG